MTTPNGVAQPARGLDSVSCAVVEISARSLDLISIGGRWGSGELGDENAIDRAPSYPSKFRAMIVNSKRQARLNADLACFAIHILRCFIWLSTILVWRHSCRKTWPPGQSLDRTGCRIACRSLPAIWCRTRCKTCCHRCFDARTRDRRPSARQL